VSCPSLICFGPALSGSIHYNTGALPLTPFHIASGVLNADTRCRVVGCVWITAVQPLETGRYARSYPAAASSLRQRLRPVLFCFCRRYSNTPAGLRLTQRPFTLLLLPLSRRLAPARPLLWRSETLGRTRWKLEPSKHKISTLPPGWRWTRQPWRTSILPII
jgi:hypothetical protein